MPIVEALTEVVEGWTNALPFTLKADDVAIDLTGLTVKIYLKDNRGAYLQNGTTGVLAVTNTTAGVLTYTPASTSELLAARTPYKVRFSLTDSTGGIVYFPNIDEDLLKVNHV